MHCFWGFAAVLTLLAAEVSAAEAPRVAASIKPLHALVSGVMEGVGEPDLIIKGGGSPHSYTFKPSDARALSKADAVFWIGDSVETFLKRPIETLAPDALSVEMMETPGLTLLPLRDGGAWDTHDHEAHDGHGDQDGRHDDNEAEDHDDHDTVDDNRGGDHREMSAHIWLDPVNAKRMVDEIAARLGDIDAGNAAAYRANAAALSTRLDTLSDDIARELTPVRDQPFVVFHDAYHYLEARYGLNAVGSVTLSPSVQPGAARIAELRDKIEKTGAVCIFSEPQFTPKLAEVLVEGTGLRKGVLDPLGAELASGPELYFEMMRGNAEALKTCLSIRQG